MRIESILPLASQRLITIEANASLADAAKLLGETHRALLVVCNSERVMVGVITKTDVVREVARNQESFNTITAAAAMTIEVTVCRPDDLIHDVLATMKERGLVHIPVIDERGRPSGVVNARDALQALLRDVTDEDLLLRAYIMGIGYR
jgi:CBS domain-containing protein